MDRNGAVYNYVERQWISLVHDYVHFETKLAFRLCQSQRQWLIEFPRCSTIATRWIGVKFEAKVLDAAMFRHEHVVEGY